MHGRLFDALALLFLARSRGDVRLGDHVVAGLTVVGQILATDALDTVVGGIQMLVGNEDHVDVVALFHFGNRLAFLVEQEGGHFDRQLCLHPPGVFLQGFFLDDAQDGKGQGFHITDMSLAITARADLVC